MSADWPDETADRPVETAAVGWPDETADWPDETADVGLVGAALEGSGVCSEGCEQLVYLSLRGGESSIVGSLLGRGVVAHVAKQSPAPAGDRANLMGAEPQSDRGIV